MRSASLPLGSDSILSAAAHNGWIWAGSALGCMTGQMAELEIMHHLGGHSVEVRDSFRLLYYLSTHREVLGVC